LIQRHFPQRFEELPPAIFLEHYVEERTPAGRLGLEHWLYSSRPTPPWFLSARACSENGICQRPGPTRFHLSVVARWAMCTCCETGRANG
jgi:hypothetical protein